MIPYPGCESYKVCLRCGMGYHVAQFPFVGEVRSDFCLFCHQEAEKALTSPVVPSSGKRRRFRWGFKC